MGKYMVSLVLISSLIFGTTIQTKIIESTLNFEGSKYDTISKSSVRGIEKSTLKVFNKKYGKNYKISTLTHNQAVEILTKMYWNERLNYITNDNVKWAIFDWRMNSNSNIVDKKLNAIFGLKSNDFSLELVDKINNSNPKWLINKICDKRLAYLKSLKMWKYYSSGWSNRVETIRGGLK